MTYPATNLNEAVGLIVPDSNAFHEIINGEATETVTLPEGDSVPTVRKAIADSLLFKNPIPWDEGNNATDYLQLRTFTDNLVYWAPNATVSNPVPMGVTPVGDSNWKLAPLATSKDYIDNQDLASEEHLLGVGTVLYKGSNGSYVQNGDLVPVDTTHLTVLINGEPEYVKLRPLSLSGGVVSLLNEDSVTIGGIDTLFSSARIITYYEDLNDSAIDKMFAQSTSASLIGDILKTGGTDWKRISKSAPITSDNFRAFNAVNLLDFSSSDGDDAMLARAVTYVRSNNKELFAPAGEYNFTQAAPDGAPFTLTGEGVNNTIFNLDFSSPDYLFEMVGQNEKQLMSRFTVRGPSNYTSNESFLYADQGYHMWFDLLQFTRLNETVYCNNAYYTTITRCRAQFVRRGFRFDLPNGAAIRDSNVQRFADFAFYYLRGLSSLIDNVVAEYGGQDGGTGVAVRFQATQNARLRNFYTEGEMNTDIHLHYANARSCVDVELSGLWLNSSATKLIHAQSVKGLRVNGVVLNTPSAAALIDETDANYGVQEYFVGTVTQVDQNANNFSGDVRGAGQNLIPIHATNNSKVIMTSFQPKVGDGSQSDLSNIANHTAFDSNGRLPRSLCNKRPSMVSLPSGLTATSSISADVFGAESSGIKIWSDQYTGAKLTIICDISNSASLSFSTSNFRITNSTTGNQWLSGNKNFNLPASNQIIELYVNLAQGVNDITMAITRSGGGSGSNTVSVTDILIE